MKNPKAAEFILRVGELLTQMGLPGEVSEESKILPGYGALLKGAELQILMLFPNLSASEQTLVIAAHQTTLRAMLVLNTLPQLRGVKGAEKWEEEARLASHQEMPQLRQEIEESGLLSKLTDFQFEVLDELLEVKFLPEDQSGSDDGEHA